MLQFLQVYCLFTSLDKDSGICGRSSGSSSFNCKSNRISTKSNTSGIVTVGEGTNLGEWVVHSSCHIFYYYVTFLAGNEIFFANESSLSRTHIVNPFTRLIRHVMIDQDTVGFTMVVRLTHVPIDICWLGRKVQTAAIVSLYSE